MYLSVRSAVPFRSKSGGGVALNDIVLAAVDETSKVLHQAKRSATFTGCMVSSVITYPIYLEAKVMGTS